MDPFSAILLIGLFTVATVKTAGSAATDGLAQAQGQTPPSQERWRAKEQRRRQRGEQPREDPGGLRRIFQQHTEAAAEKSAAKHDGKMRYLRKHGDDIAEGKRKRMEAADRRREYVGGKLAAAGGSSWDALKSAAQKAAEAKRTHDDRKAEEQAWRENEHRDEQEAHNRNNYRAGGDIEPDAAESAAAEDEPAAEQSRADNATDGSGDATVLPFARRDSDDGDQAEQPAADTADTSTTDSEPTDSDSEPAAQKDSEIPEKVNNTGPDPDKRAHETDQPQAEREHRERMAQIQMQSTSTTETTGGDTMNAPNSSSVEITDLETAQLRSDESAQYAATVQSVLDTQIAGIQKALAGMEAEAAQQEQGSTSLTGEGFDTGITGRFDRGQQSFTNAVAALRALDQSLNTAKDEVNLAQNEMKSASGFFSQQRAISESLSAAGQGGGISSRTGFYTGA